MSRPDPSEDDPKYKLAERLRQNLAAINFLMPSFTSAVKRVYGERPTPADLAEFHRLKEQISALEKENEGLFEEASRMMGITVEQLDKLLLVHDEEQEPARFARRDLTEDSVPATDFIEGALMRGFSALRDLVDENWLQDQASSEYRLGSAFRKNPLSIVSGARVLSERPLMHRYAQALLVTEDFLAEQEDYDFFAGAALIPQMAILSTSLQHIRTIRGDVERRLAELQTCPSDEVESRIYELLVAGACRRRGIDVEFLEPSSQAKTPDLRVHGWPFPIVVECKRKSFLSGQELKEEAFATSFFRLLKDQAVSLGQWGIYEFTFAIEVEDLRTSDLLEAARHQNQVPRIKVPTTYPWGCVGFCPLPVTVHFPRCRLYGARFLRDVFKWNTDVPEWDGLVCQISEPAKHFVAHAEQPVGMKWNCIAEAAVVKKSRAVRAVFNKAVSQVPVGELAIIYICLREGGRPDIADERLRRAVADFTPWKHRKGIIVPNFLVQRLLPRFLLDERPDLIENAVQWYSAAYADPGWWFKTFPSCVYSKAE